MLITSSDASGYRKRISGRSSTKVTSPSRMSIGDCESPPVGRRSHVRSDVAGSTLSARIPANEATADEWTGHDVLLPASVTPSTANTMDESFFATLQIELLDRRRWATRSELARAIFEWIEAFYNPERRHSALDYHSPVTYRQRHHTAPAAVA